MSEILQMFAGNPLATLVGKKIEAATHPQLDSEDWTLNMEICDIINESEEETRNAVRALKKRVQQIDQERGSNLVKSYSLLLSVIETCVSNCTHRFHVLVLTKDFIQDLVKLIGPKNNPPIELQERVLRLIQRWADSFKSYPELIGVVQVYNDLKSKGVIFPVRDSSTDVPIETPRARSIPRPPPNTRSSSMSRSLVNQNVAGDVQVTATAAPSLIEGEVYDKIRNDLTVVQTSLSVYNSILDQVSVNKAESDNAENWTLLDQLSASTKQMKDRIVELIEKVANEDLTIELLRLNDDLNAVFERHQKEIVKRGNETAFSSSSYQQQQQHSSSSSTHQRLANTSAVAATSSSSSNAQNKDEDEEASLIDLKDDDSNSAKLKQAAIHQASASPVATGKLATSSQLHTSPELLNTSTVSDLFKQPDNSFSTMSGQTSLVDKLDKLRMNDEHPSSQHRSSGLNTDRQQQYPLPATSREQDFVEIENWLQDKQAVDDILKTSPVISPNQHLTNLSHNHESTEPVSIPNSEFENFIASRALAASSQPPKPSNPITDSANDQESTKNHLQASGKSADS